MLSLEEVRKRKTLRNFGGGRQSEQVRLLEGEIVAKHYSRTNPKHVRGFHLEVANLQRLSSCSFVPHIVAVDIPNQIIYMTYCGEKPTRYTDELKVLVRDRLQYLKKHFHMTRKFLYKKYLPRVDNVALSPSGEVNLIDFGTPWRYEPHAPVETKAVLNVSEHTRTKLLEKAKRKEQHLLSKIKRNKK